MTDYMRAMILKQPASIYDSPLQLEDVPVPRCGDGDLLVKVHACAICRTDLHVIEGDLAQKKLPIIPGHQIVGTVEQVGQSCTQLCVGDRVGVAWLQNTCGECVYCSSGRENLCSDSVFTGYHRDGGYAEYVSVPEQFAYPLPAVFDDLQAAPLLCAGIIGYRALRRSNVPDGGDLLLYGFGSSAHITMQIAGHRGCKVYVATRGAGHQDFARRLGAVWVGDTYDELPVKVDSAIVFAPVGEIVPYAMQSLKKGGVTVMAGIHMSPVPAMNYEQCLFHERDLRSVESNTKKDGELLLAEAAAVPIVPETSVFPLAEANYALQLLKNDSINGTGVISILDGDR